MRRDFFRQTLKIALPTAAQSLAVSCFSVADQIMIGQSGASVIAGVGFGAKFASLALTILAGCATGAGILAAQYEGQNSRDALMRSFTQVFILSIAICVLFIIPSLIVPQTVMQLYSPDPAVIAPAARYLSIYVWVLPLSAITSLYSVVLRCCGQPAAPLYASLAGIAANTGLNALFIFGFGWQEAGAAWASVISQALMATVTFAFIRRKLSWMHLSMSRMQPGIVLKVLLPLLITEGLWALGENIYSMVYGHTGTAEAAAMTMTIPLQSMLIGILSGFSQAAGVLVGQRLGQNRFEEAWQDSLSLIRYSLCGSLILSSLLCLAAPFYVRLFSVDEFIRQTGVGLICAFALMSIVKVQNMVVSGGILRAGGKTNLTMAIDLVGTWGFGVPLAFFALHQGYPIAALYLTLSMEEAVRMILGAIIFMTRKWMNVLSVQTA